MAGGAFWKNAEIELLERLWRDGATSGQIARATGRTRNAVMGLLFRRGLLKTRPPKSTPEERKRRRAEKQAGYQRTYRAKLALMMAAKHAKRRQARVSKVRTQPVYVPLPECVVSKSILEVSLGECRYMPGSSKLCCAKPTGDIMKSWCPEHQKMVFYS